MAGLKFSSFGAATMPLSKIVVDTDFELYPYDAKTGNVIAKSIMAPIDAPLTLPKTDPLPWPNDTNPSELASGDIRLNYTGIPIFEWINEGNEAIELSIAITTDESVSSTVRITAAGTSFDINISNYKTIIVSPVWLYPGESVQMVNLTYDWATTGVITDTGRRAPPVTLDISELWLSLDIDFGGLTSTIRVLDTDVPYADYPKYFPIRPTSIHIDGVLGVRQNRPEIRGYVWQ